MTALLAAAAAATIHFTPLKSPGHVLVVASNAPLGSSLTLHLVHETNPHTPAIFAKVESIGGRLSLQPSFALVAGSAYEARLRQPDGRHLRKRHVVPILGKRSVPRVLTVYPRAKAVPANLLKFYLYFSEPMREGREVFDLIRLEDETGKTVHSPWRRQELWSDNAQRLTLWIHPGRIKRGVNLRETFGPVLKPNARYTLVIDSSMSSAAGIAMAEDFRLHFQTNAEDRERPVPTAWELKIPGVNSRKPLRITAPESFDHALLSRHQWIENQDGKRISGTFHVDAGERSWSFEPRLPWETGQHRLCVDDWLEDLAGNTPTRKFERHVDDPEPKQETICVSFAISGED